MVSRFLFNELINSCQIYQLLSSSYFTVAVNNFFFIVPSLSLTSMRISYEPLAVGLKRALAVVVNLSPRSFQFVFVVLLK